MISKIVVGIAVLLLSSLVSVGVNGTAPCRFGPEFEPNGMQVFLPHPIYYEFPASATTYVAHGWWQWPACFEDRSEAWMCEYIHSHILFELKINGTLVSPDYIHVTWAPLETPGFTETWLVRWVYEFPPLHFAPGIYILEGTWTAPDASDPNCWPESSFERSDLGGFTRTTVCVMWP